MSSSMVNPNDDPHAGHDHSDHPLTTLTTPGTRALRRTRS